MLRAENDRKWLWAIMLPATWFSEKPILPVGLQSHSADVISEMFLAFMSLELRFIHF